MTAHLTSREGGCGMSATLVRVQDRHGRGPYRPGLPALWSDYEDGYDCPPWWAELGEPIDVAHERCVGPYHFGCAFRSHDQLARWFNEREQRALDRLGFAVALVKPAVIIAETPRQVVFGSVEPLNRPLRTMKLGSNAARLAA